MKEKAWHCKGFLGRHDRVVLLGASKNHFSLAITELYIFSLWNLVMKEHVIFHCVTVLFFYQLVFDDHVFFSQVKSSILFFHRTILILVCVIMECWPHSSSQ